MKINTKQKPLLLALCLLLAVWPLYANSIQVKEALYAVDLPEGWQVLDKSDPARISYMSAGGEVMLKIMVYNSDKYPDAAAFAKAIGDELQAEGDATGFSYLENQAILADLTFSTGKTDVRGYSVFIGSKPYAYALISFATLADYDYVQDEMLSALDSFTLTDKGKLLPGPISAFLSQSGPQDPVECKLTLEKQVFSYTTTQSILETSQDIINREARILSAFQSQNTNAWYRFYRMIYKDNYAYIGTLYPFFQAAYTKADKKAKITKILQWVQGFTYTRTGTIADFTSPLEAAVTASGDCDSRVLLYIILLHYMGIDAVLLASGSYAHSAAGISVKDYPGTGAMITIGMQKYIYAELTEKVDIGMIPSKMADPTKWIGFSLNK